jgi:NADH-quinone oxidoreductase subunit N
VFFDDLLEMFDKPIDRPIRIIMALTGIVTMLFFLWPSPLLDSAALAAASLFAVPG